MLEYSLRHWYSQEARIKVSTTFFWFPLVALLGAVLIINASHAATSFTGIGSLEGNSGQARAVSADGTVVVGTSTTAGQDRAIRWTSAGGITALGSLGAGDSRANAASTNGDVIVGRAFNGNTNEAFRWSAGSGMIGLGVLSQDGSEALGVSGDGAVVAGFDGLVGRGCTTARLSGTSDCPPQIGTEQAFVWRATTGMQQLPRLPEDPFARAHAVSTDGSTVIGTSFQYIERTLSSAGVGIFLVDPVGASTFWDADNTIGTIAPSDARPLGITANDEVYFDNQQIGPISGPLRPLSSGLDTAAVAADGTTAVGQAQTFNTAAAFRGQLVHLKPLLIQFFDLDLTGWVLREATGISADGLTIVGNGLNPLGEEEGWIAQLDAWPDAAELANVPLVTAFESTTPLASAVLPASRSARVGEVVTVFASLINTELQFDAVGCRVGLASDIPASLDYHQTDPATNATIGPQNTPADIAAGGGVQTFVIGITPTAAFDPIDVRLSYDCANSIPARSFVGVNTLSLSASDEPVADVIAITTTTDLTIPSGGQAFAAVAVANVGSSAEITASLDSAGAQLPLTAMICQTNSATGVCLESMSEQSTLTLDAGGTASFMMQIQATEAILFDPAKNRLFIRFHDASNVLRGATSTAVSTE